MRTLVTTILLLVVVFIATCPVWATPIDQKVAELRQEARKGNWGAVRELQREIRDLRSRMAFQEANPIGGSEETHSKVRNWMVSEGFRPAGYIMAKARQEFVTRAELNGGTVTPGPAPAATAPSITTVIPVQADPPAAAAITSPADSPADTNTNAAKPRGGFIMPWWGYLIVVAVAVAAYFLWPTVPRIKQALCDIGSDRRRCRAGENWKFSCGGRIGRVRFDYEHEEKRP